MNIVILDEYKKRMLQLSEILEQKGFKVKKCSCSGEFMDTVSECGPDALILDTESWLRGRVIYNYFNFIKKMSDYSVIFYNAPENFTGISNSISRYNEKIFKRKTDYDTIVEAL